MAGVVFGEVEVSLFVAGAAFGEIWNDSRSAEMLYFSIQNAVSWPDHGRIMVRSCSDHGRIGRALEMTFHLFSPNFSPFLDGNFSWQVQYLVSLDTDTCCSAHCK